MFRSSSSSPQPVSLHSSINYMPSMHCLFHLASVSSTPPSFEALRQKSVENAVISLLFHHRWLFCIIGIYASSWWVTTIIASNLYASVHLLFISNKHIFISLSHGQCFLCSFVFIYALLHMPMEVLCSRI